MSYFYIFLLKVFVLLYLGFDEDFGVEGVSLFFDLEYPLLIIIFHNSKSLWLEYFIHIFNSKVLYNTFNLSPSQINFSIHRYFLIFILKICKYIFVDISLFFQMFHFLGKMLILSFKKLDFQEKGFGVGTFTMEGWNDVFHVTRGGVVTRRVLFFGFWGFGHGGGWGLDFGFLSASG